MNIEQIRCAEDFAHAVEALKAQTGPGADIASLRASASKLGRRAGDVFAPHESHQIISLAENMRGDLRTAFLHGIDVLVQTRHPIATDGLRQYVNDALDWAVATPH